MSQAEQRLTVPEDEDNEINLSDAWRQILASCLSFSLVIQVGVNMSYSAVLLPQLNQVGSTIKVSVDEASWIASLVTVMIPVGSLLAGPSMDRYGRRKVSALSGLPFAAGWLTAALATDVAQLYVSRVLCGLGAGFSTVCLVYCSEISHPDYRPMLLGLNSVFVSLGILVTCSLGVTVGWRLQAMVYCALSLVTVALHWPLPESPYWLRSQSQAEDSLRWLYRRPEALRAQLNELARERERRSRTPDRAAGLRTCLEPVLYKPMLLLSCIFLFQQLSGAYVVIFYAVEIFRKTNVRYEDLSLVMFGAIRLVMAVASLLLSRVLGRRPLLFVSGIGMCVSCLAAFALRQANNESPLVAVCVLVYVCFGALGFLGIPWTLTGELFPVRVKGAVSGLMITVAYVFMFAVVKVFPLLMESLDVKYIFLLFSGNVLAAVLIVFRWLPETFGVSFAEIEKHFR